MTERNRKVIRSDCTHSHAAPNTPITKQSKSFKEHPFPLLVLPDGKLACPPQLIMNL